MQFRLYAAAAPLIGMMVTLLPQPASAQQQEPLSTAATMPLTMPSQAAPSDTDLTAAVAARQDSDPQFNGSIKDEISSSTSQQ
ncbi:hypothetical protein [Paracidovorax wautersii]|uniref:Uncharacterized protein n=1 Tax=Paracidovorax wautersii TaxID=1177982 RepID=A0A1I2H4Y0_9BURK|nr:hypothetical protein [Paracidovorax wautersii]SFF24430.1 hypothetical protein SAMN04489711_11935 [Paracidovorax wautersii]